MAEWNPEDEVNPEKMQKEQLELQREALGFLRAEKERNEKLEREGELDKERIANAMRGVIGPFRQPTLKETSERLKMLWGEVKRIAPDAPEAIQAAMFNLLLSYAAVQNEPSVGEPPPGLL